jgi:hypothetical protein
MNNALWILGALGVIAFLALIWLALYARSDQQVGKPDHVSERDWLKVTAHLERDRAAIITAAQQDQRARVVQMKERP